MNHMEESKQVSFASPCYSLGNLKQHRFSLEKGGLDMADSIVKMPQDYIHIQICIKTDGRLGLSNVGSLFQRIDTGVRYVSGGGTRLKVELVGVENGSIVVRIAIITAALTAGQLVLGLVDYMETNGPAIRANNLILNEDNGIEITISGDGQSHTIRGEDLDLQLDAAAANRPPHIVEPTSDFEQIEYSQSGMIIRIDSEIWIRLEERPGMMLKLRDGREAGSKYLDENRRYTFEGTAYIARAGQDSFFVLSNAIPL
jgi:hypothetical protein